MQHSIQSIDSIVMNRKVDYYYVTTVHSTVQIQIARQL